MVSAKYNYEEQAQRVVEVLRQEFPTDTINTNEGYNGRVHVKLVSRRFNGMNEQEKQQFIWDLFRDKLDADAQVISLALVYGTDEL